jgi:hypothetical protein
VPVLKHSNSELQKRGRKMNNRRKWEEHTFLIVSTIRLLAEMDKETTRHITEIADKLRIVYENGGNLDDSKIMEQYHNQN